MTQPWVTIWQFPHIAEAIIAKGKLHAAGIESVLANENMARMGYINAVGGVSLQVDPHQASEALSILQEPIPQSLKVAPSSPMFMQPRCARCSSLHVTNEGPSETLSAGSWLSARFNIRASASDWHCSDCGHRWQSPPEDSSADTSDTSEVMTRIYVATTNSGKLKDFAGAATEIGIDVVPMPGMNTAPEVIEDGVTFEENARKKAEAYSKLLPNELVIADDSGLEVGALDGAPGVNSARFAATEPGKKPSDSDNNYKLLNELQSHPGSDRIARFVCVIAAARDGGILRTFRGEAQGEILPTPIGKRGFGYDPLFFVPQANKTFAEMNAEEKALYSHRGAAFRAFLEWLKPEIERGG